MPRKPVLFNEQRLQAMMDRRGIDAVILRGTENSKYITEFFHNGGNLGYRPFTVFYFRDPARKPAFVVPAVDLHLAMTSTWIEDVRAYAMAEFFTDVDVHFYQDFFEAAQAILAERNVKGMTIGTEGENLTSGFRARLEEMLAGNRIVDVALDMDIVRMVKTPEEIRRLRRATEITVQGARKLPRRDQAGQHRRGPDPRSARADDRRRRRRHSLHQCRLRPEDLVRGAQPVPDRAHACRSAISSRSTWARCIAAIPAISCAPISSVTRPTGTRRSGRG